MNQTKQNTNVAIVKFNGAKTTVATAMDARQSAILEAGDALGHTQASADGEWADAIKLCKQPGDRNILRAGFVPAYMGATGCTKKSADDRFDYLARKYAAGSSRKKAGRVAKKAGRKEKTATGAAEQVNASAIAQRLAAVLHYVAEAQQKHVGDSEMLEVLGDIAALCGGKGKGKSK